MGRNQRSWQEPGSLSKIGGNCANPPFSNAFRRILVLVEGHIRNENLYA
jgi:hypothetical protein